MCVRLEQFDSYLKPATRLTPLNLHKIKVIPMIL
jgi:hypothetical protein